MATPIMENEHFNLWFDSTENLYLGGLKVTNNNLYVKILKNKMMAKCFYLWGFEILLIGSVTKITNIQDKVLVLYHLRFILSNIIIIIIESLILFIL